MMLSTLDVLKALAAGPATLPGLEAALDPHGTAGLLHALDACVEEGLVAVTWQPRGVLDEDRYRLTRRGQRVLRLAPGR